MKAHIAKNQKAGTPLVLGWNLSGSARGIIDGMAPAFGLKFEMVAPADAGKTIAQLMGEQGAGGKTLSLEYNAYPPTIVMANFKDKDMDTFLDLLKTAEAQIPVKAVVTPTNRNWAFADLLAHLLEEKQAFEAAQAAEAAKA